MPTSIALEIAGQFPMGFGLVWRTALRRAGDLSDLTGPALAHAIGLFQLLRSPPSLRQVNHFLEFRSFSMRSTSDSSATIFFFSSDRL